MPGQGRELFHQAHYNVLAKRIRELKTEYASNPDAFTALSELEERLATWFEEDNPRFDPEAWRKATSMGE